MFSRLRPLTAAQPFCRPLAASQCRSFVASAPNRIVDQTKKNNDSSQEKRESHKQQAKKPGNSDQAGDHPAKQSDTQETPSKSTGIRKDGPGSTKAGEGSDKSGIYKNEDLSKRQTEREKEGGREGSMGSATNNDPNRRE